MLHLRLLILAAFISLPTISAAQSQEVSAQPAIDVLETTRKKPISRLLYKIDNQPFVQINGRLVPSPLKVTSSKKPKEQASVDKGVKPAVNKNRKENPLFKEKT